MSDIVHDAIKACSRCGGEFPATTEYFYRNANSSDGLCSRCKRCEKARVKEWWERNPQKGKAQRSRVRSLDPEKHKEYDRVYRQRMRDRLESIKALEGKLDAQAEVIEKQAVEASKASWRIQELEARVAQQLAALQLAYRKHHLEDDTVGWDELSDALLNALCESMGDAAFQAWAGAKVKELQAALLQQPAIRYEPVPEDTIEMVDDRTRVEIVTIDGRRGVGTQLWTDEHWEKIDFTPIPNDWMVCRKVEGESNE